MARDGDVDAAKRLIKGNLQLVVAIARRYTAAGWPLLDLVQEGNLGLVQAVDGFDPDRGFPFRTYAMWWIRQSIAQALEEHGPGVTLPASASEPLDVRLQEVWDGFVASEGRQPTLAELAAQLGVSEAQVVELLGPPPELS